MMNGSQPPNKVPSRSNSFEERPAMTGQMSYFMPFMGVCVTPRRQFCPGPERAASPVTQRAASPDPWELRGAKVVKAEELPWELRADNGYPSYKDDRWSPRTRSSQRLVASPRHGSPAPSAVAPAPRAGSPYSGAPPFHPSSSSFEKQFRPAQLQRATSPLEGAGLGAQLPRATSPLEGARALGRRPGPARVGALSPARPVERLEPPSVLYPQTSKSGSSKTEGRPIVIPPVPSRGSDVRYVVRQEPDGRFATGPVISTKATPLVSPRPSAREEPDSRTKTSPMVRAQARPGETYVVKHHDAHLTEDPTKVRRFVTSPQPIGQVRVGQQAWANSTNIVAGAIRPEAHQLTNMTDQQIRAANSSTAVPTLTSSHTSLISQVSAEPAGASHFDSSATQNVKPEEANGPDRGRGAVRSSSTDASGRHISVPVNELNIVRQELNNICNTMANKSGVQVELFNRSMYERLGKLEDQVNRLMDLSSADSTRLPHTLGAGDAAGGGQVKLSTDYMEPSKSTKQGAAKVSETSQITSQELAKASSNPQPSRQSPHLRANADGISPQAAGFNAASMLGAMPHETMSATSTGISNDRTTLETSSFVSVPSDVSKGSDGVAIANDAQKQDNIVSEHTDLSVYSEDASETYIEMLIEKNGPDDRLGLDVRSFHGGLSIIGIYAGCALDRANKRSSGHILKVGDIIHQVNDITEPETALVAELQGKSTLRIWAVRVDDRVDG